ncbi:unnamed protein product, partial [marine sediment metagenome]
MGYNPEWERGEGVALQERPSVVYQGVPEGHFVSPYVEVVGHPDNKVPVGEQIRLRGYYRVSCPGQPWYAPAWTMGMKAVGDGIAVKMYKTLMTEGPVTSSDDLTVPSLPIMPNKTVELTVELWGNEEAYE